MDKDSHKIESNSKFSLFRKPIKNKLPFREATTKDVYEMIVSETYQAVTIHLRSFKGKPSKIIKKTEFDFAAFSGTFKARSQEGLITHSGLICIDLDHLQNLADVKAQILNELIPELMFISPSGDGLKVVYRIDINKKNHLDYFKALSAYFKQQFCIEVDESGKDIARACFLPHDKDCHYTDTPEVLDIAFIDTFAKADEVATHQPTKFLKKTGRKIDIAVSMINRACDNEKHNELLKASRLMGGYIASGEVDEQSAITELENAINKRDIHSFKDAQKTIKDGIEYGKKAPIKSQPALLPSDTPLPDTKAENKETIPLLPIDGLPDFLKKLITECARIYGTHQDFWAGALLASSALAMGQSHQLKGKYSNAAVLWLALVAPSGTGKTEPLSFAFKPFHTIDAQNIEEFETLIKVYEITKAMSKKERTDAGITDMPDLPICKQYVLSDTTPEAVIQANKNNTRGVNIERDELHGWLLDMGRYSKSGEMQNWLSAWSQKSMTVNRKGSSPIKIKHPFINITGGLQPEIIPEFAKDNRAVNGTMQRFCFVFPDEALRPQYRSDVLPNKIIQQYGQYISNLLSLKEECESVNLSFEAQNQYEVFANKNAEIINAEKTDYLKALYSKLDIISLRIALIIHVSKWACTAVDEEKITPETMQVAIDITEYFRATGVKVYNYLKAGNFGLNKKAVAVYLHGLGASQNEIAASLKVSQPYITKILKS